MSRVMRTSIGTVTWVSIVLKKEERKQKGSYEYRTEHKTRSARNTGRKTGGEDSIRTRHRLMETGTRQGMCIRETEAIIGKAPRLGIHTRVRQTPSRVSAKL